MTSPEALRRVAAVLRRQPEIAPGDAERVADLLDQLARAPRTYAERRSNRDEWLERIAHRFYIGATRWFTASTIEKGLANYQCRGGWLEDQNLRENPSASKIKGYYWEILMLIPETPSARQIERILKKSESLTSNPPSNVKPYRLNV